MASSPSKFGTGKPTTKPSLVRKNAITACTVDVGRGANPSVANLEAQYRHAASLFRAALETQQCHVAAVLEKSLQRLKWVHLVEHKKPLNVEVAGALEQDDIIDAIIGTGWGEVMDEDSYWKHLDRDECQDESNLTPASAPDPASVPDPNPDTAPASASAPVPDPNSDTAPASAPAPVPVPHPDLPAPGMSSSSSSPPIKRAKRGDGDKPKKYKSRVCPLCKKTQTVLSCHRSNGGRLVHTACR